MLTRFRLFLSILLLLAALSARAGYDLQWVEFPALEPFNGEPVALTALQFKPEGTGPFPALVLMHGCSGMYTSSGYVTASYRIWAELLAEHGYVALLVDSFNPRGYRTICELQKRPILESRERVRDAYAAVRWLSEQPYVARERVGLIGWSNGATGTLYSVRETNRRDPGFRAAVAFYPGCRTLARSKTAYRPYAPLLILSGEEDDWTPAVHCKALVSIARAADTAIEIVTYPGAHHSFDRINLPVRYRPNVRNLSKPDRLGATVGGNREAREDAIKRTLQFFDRILKS